MKKIFIFILVSLCALGLQAQNIKVSGTVVSESDNEPLMGAYVKVAGATTVPSPTSMAITPSK
jgi:predicted lipoprotein